MCFGRGYRNSININKSNNRLSPRKQKIRRHMALEHKFLVWDVAQNYGEPVNRISALPSWYLDVLGYPTAIYTNDKQCATQFHFHSNMPHTITKMNDNINMEFLVWDVHKIMASSNRLMEFWFGICTKLWRAQTGRWNSNPLLLIMGYPTAIHIYTNVSKYYTDSLPLQHNFRPPLLVLDIQQQYTQTINNTLHRFTSTPAYHILSQNVMPT